MAKSVLPDKWKVSYVTPIFNKSRRNNVEDYRGVLREFCGSVVEILWEFWGNFDGIL
jgi:hypothetical protein